MRLLLIAVAILVLLIAGVIAIGYSLPKRHTVSRRAVFHASAEQLFALVTGPQNWRPDVLRCEPVPDASGRDLIRESTRNGENITYELLDRRVPYAVTRRIATENLPYSGLWKFSFEPVNGNTVVRITEDGEVYNPIFRFVSRFVLGHTRSLDDYLHALARATGQEIEIH